MVERIVGIIGGSGIEDLPGLEEQEWRDLRSPFGLPSSPILHARLGATPVRFLSRHGKGHALAPTDIPYRANIDALKRAGCTDVISLSAVGSLHDALPPGTFVLVDQFIDRTFARQKSFFGTGCVAHVSMAEPVCRCLIAALATGCAALGIPHRRGGTYLAMEGPQFSTRAESRLYRNWGADVIGMTNMPEAKLAREAEICYGSVAMVTDFDAWDEARPHATVEMIVGVLMANAARACDLVRAVAPMLAGVREPCPAGCDRALENAIVTAPAWRDVGVLARLDAVAGRVLG